MTERLPFHFSLSCIGEGNGNPLRCSCLENPRDGGAWWAACVWGRTGSDTTEATQQQQQQQCYFSGSLESWSQCSHSKGSGLDLEFAWVYIFFSSGQVLLSALSWCSACPSVSEGVFLMYPWKEMYSTSTQSSAILFSSSDHPILNCLPLTPLTNQYLPNCPS